MSGFYQHKTLPQEHYIAILKRLIPDFKILDIEKIHGYDSVVLIINHERLFKFPQRTDVFDQYKKELSIFPFLEEHCTFKVPHIISTWGVMGDIENFALEYEIMAGNHLTTELEKNKFNQIQLEKIGRSIGRYLSELHTVEIQEIKNRGIPDFDPGYWPRQYEFIRNHCFSFWNAAQRSWASELYEKFLNIWERQTFEPVFIHGDMGNWHIFARQEEIIGFIDWGGMKIDDPARDILWHEQMDIENKHIGKGVLDEYQLKRGSFDSTFLERTKFYKKRAPVSKFIKGVEFNDKQRIVDGYKLLEQVMAS